MANQEFTVASLLDPRTRVNPEAANALRTFRRSKPWRGSLGERVEKFQALHNAFCNAYGINPTFEFIAMREGEETPQGDGGFDFHGNRIVLLGKLSVVTFLHCWAKARGMDPRKCFSWSLSVFQRFFPVSFARREQDGPFLR